LKKRLTILVGSICLVAILVACAAPTPKASAPATIKIGAAISQTGFMSGIALQCQKAYQVWEEVVNEAGGIYVKEYDKKIPVELKILNDESQGLKAIFQLEALNEWGAVAYLGGVGCESFEIGTAVAMKNKIPWIGPGCCGITPHWRQNEFLFSTFFKTPYFSPLVFDMIEAMPEPRPNKVAIFEINQLDCNEAAQYWRESAKEGGFEVVFDEKYAAGTSDFSALITGAKAAGAEILVAYPTPPGGPLLVKQMKELDFSPKLCYWCRGPNTIQFGPSLGELSDYVCFPDGWGNMLTLPGSDELNAKYEEMHGERTTTTTGSAYAACQVLEAAIEKAGTLDSIAIRDALRATDMETVAGRIHFADDGHALDRTIFIFQWMNQEPHVVFYNEAAEKYKDYIPMVDFKLQPAWSER